MSNKKQTTAGLEPQASSCKQDVCRHESNDGRVTNYETEAEDFFVGLFLKMRQSYGESVRQMLMEHDGDKVLFINC